MECGTSTLVIISKMAGHIWSKMFVLNSNLISKSLCLAHDLKMITLTDPSQAITVIKNLGVRIEQAK